MKSWLLFIIPPLIIILILVLFQILLTRHAMARFAKRHAMTYEKSKRGLFNIFDIGKITGKVGRATFFMGIVSKSWGFGPVAKQDYAETRIPNMQIKIEGMPEQLIIRVRSPGRAGDIVEALSRKTGIPMLKTGDEAFDSRFDVIGYKEEAFPWLTEQRRETIAAFISSEKYLVAKGRLVYTTGKTYISLDDMEEAFVHLTTTQRELQKVQ